MNGRLFDATGASIAKSPRRARADRNNCICGIACTLHKRVVELMTSCNYRRTAFLHQHAGDTLQGVAHDDRATRPASTANASSVLRSPEDYPGFGSAWQRLAAPCGALSGYAGEAAAGLGAVSFHNRVPRHGPSGGRRQWRRRCRSTRSRLSKHVRTVLAEHSWRQRRRLHGNGSGACEAVRPVPRCPQGGAA